MHADHMQMTDWGNQLCTITVWFDKAYKARLQGQPADAARAECSICRAAPSRQCSAREGSRGKSADYVMPACPTLLAGAALPPGSVCPSPSAEHHPGPPCKAAATPTSDDVEVRSITVCQPPALHVVSTLLTNLRCFCSCRRKPRARAWLVTGYRWASC